jgi:hypothetical protein
MKRRREDKNSSVEPAAVESVEPRMSADEGSQVVVRVDKNVIKSSVMPRFNADRVDTCKLKNLNGRLHLELLYNKLHYSSTMQYHQRYFEDGRL